MTDGQPLFSVPFSQIHYNGDTIELRLPVTAMPTITPNSIVEKIAAQLDATVPSIEDESHLHAGHLGASEGSHFRMVVVSPQFVGLSMVKQHRLVYEALAEEMQSGIHALALQTYTPEQWGDR